jgi:hypothetical protein
MITILITAVTVLLSSPGHSDEAFHLLQAPRNAEVGPELPELTRGAKITRE